jgi:hypothetical protein
VRLPANVAESSQISGKNDVRPFSTRRDLSFADIGFDMSNCGMGLPAISQTFYENCDLSFVILTIAIFEHGTT